MLDVIDAFLGLPASERELFCVGRRLGQLRGLDDLADPAKHHRAAAVRDAVAAEAEAAGMTVDGYLHAIRMTFV